MRPDYSGKLGLFPYKRIPNSGGVVVMIQGYPKITLSDQEIEGNTRAQIIDLIVARIEWQLPGDHYAP